ncbi:MAG: GFA family protein [Brucellaceae bacterium]|nr:GFA family protein [Brucellaceae bacterium]
MTASPPHRGHCRCGSVVLLAHADPDFSVYCHCDDCRRATGAPVLASIGFPNDAIEWESSKTLARYRNGTASRLFCSMCGSPVAQEHESAADRIFINTGFMDDPEAFPPTAHTFAGRQLSWLKLADDLPRAEKTLLIKTDELGDVS